MDTFPQPGGEGDVAMLLFVDGQDDGSHQGAYDYDEDDSDVVPA